jgi:hypothetical protein
MQWTTRGAVMAVCSLGFITAARAIHTAPVTPVHRPLIEGAKVPADVKRIFARACQDCHSDNTVWPWYSQLFPMSRLITADVQQGRAFLNLSEWQSYSRGRKLGFLMAISNAAVDREMPPFRYLIIHGDARLSDAERHEIADWATQEATRLH